MSFIFKQEWLDYRDFKELDLLVVVIGGLPQVSEVGRGVSGVNSLSPAVRNLGTKLSEKD